MQSHKPLMNPENAEGGVSLVFGQASLWMGLVLAVAWWFVFVVVLPRATGHGVQLPIVPPAIGLAFGGLGWLTARWGRRPVIGVTIAGLLLNGLLLVLALILLFRSLVP